MRYIYVIRNIVNTKVYVGQTKNPKSRKADHFCAARSGNSNYHIHRSMHLHGVENFSFEILEECEDDVTNERERHWIAHFDSFNPEKGYNLTKGGDQNFEISDETRKRMSVAKRGKPLSEQNRKNLWRSRDRKFSNQHRLNLSLAAKKRKASDETKKKMSDALKGKLHRCGNCKQLGHTRPTCKELQNG